MKLEKILTHNAKIYSFDVYDTVITRKYLTPGGVFSAVQKRLFEMIDVPAEFAAHFRAFREQAEIGAFKKSEFAEITLDEIYETLRASHGLEEGLTREIKNLEIEEELNCAVAVQKITGVINTLRSRNKKVIFVSDMYLPEEVIRQTLNKLNIARPRDDIYVSNKFRARKADGQLFRLVLNKEGRRPSEIVHVGNNWSSDIAPARKIGIKTVYFEDTKNNRYESIYAGVLRQTPKVKALTECLAGRIKAQRLSANSDPYQLGSAVAGPLLISYVSWVLEQAKTRGIKNLYFVARDGQVLYEIAGRIKAKNAGYEDQKISYIYGSRQAWHFPSITELDAEALEIMFKSYGYLNLNNVAGRFYLDPGQLQKLYTEKYSVFIDARQCLSHDQIEKLKNLLRLSDVREFIQKSAAKKRYLLYEYLARVGLTEAENCAIVDIGWHGRLQDSLQKVLNCFGCFKVNLSGMFLGLNIDSAGKNTGKKFSYLVGADEGIPVETLPSWIFSLIEILTAADHGTTCGYRKNTVTGTIEPQLQSAVNHDLKTWDLKSYRQGIYDLIDGLSPDHISAMAGYYREHPRIFQETFQRLTVRPGKNEAELLGKIHFTSDQLDMSPVEFGPKLSFSSALRYGLARDNKVKKEITSWIEGSRRRSSAPSQIALFAARALNKYLFKR